MGRSRWTPDEEALLRSSMAQGGLTAAYAAFPSRSENSVHNKAQVMGLLAERGPRRVWSSAEDAVLRSNYPDLGPGGIAERGLLPGRSQRAIVGRASKLGVYRSSRGDRTPCDDAWTPNRERFVRDLMVRLDERPSRVCLVRAANLLDVTEVELARHMRGIRLRGEEVA